MITPFEYIIVLIAIILGMGITQIVSGMANMVHRWDRVTIYWPHLMLIMLVFVIHIQEWWVIYEMRDFKQWRFATFLFIILYPVNLYILARILFPIVGKGSILDLKKFYFENFRRIYLFTITLDVLAIIDNIFLADYKPRDQIVQFMVLAILITVLINNNKSEWLHKSIVVVLFLITVITFALTWNTLMISN